ncbi:MAG: FKBP-type peptidyl-prolyl cis-trans isomerase [Cellulophaga sp.]
MNRIANIFVFCLLVSCSLEKEKKEEEDFVAKNEVEIKEYIKTHNLTAEKSSTGLYYVITELGNGEHPTKTSSVTVAYKGYYTDGSVFDKSSDDGITFNLQQVIKGWTEGITYFKEGGSGILLVPSYLGYGSNNYNGIPGGSVLVFDIKLVEVK